MQETIRNIKKVYQYGRAYKKNLIMLVIACISGTIVGVIIPLLTARQIVYFTSNMWIQLLSMSLIIFLAEAYKSFAAYFFTRKNNQHFTRNTMKNLQVALGDEILKISQKELDTNSSGMFIQRITNDTLKMTAFFWDSLNCLMRIFTNIGALFATFIINKPVFLYYLFVTIVLTYLHLVKTKKFGNKDIEYRNKTEKVSSLTGELVRGVRDIKMLNAKNNFMSILEDNINTQNKKRIEMSEINGKYTFGIEFLRAVFEFGLVVLLIFLIQNQGLQMALAIALFNYKSGIMNVIMEKFSAFMQLIKDFNISCNRVFSILDNTTFEKETFGNKNLENLKGNLEFKNVNFEYIKNNPVLKDLSFKIQAGEMIGFVGKSGTGKTTIFNLICKMYNIKSGKILIENTDINELDEPSIRKNITIISQNPYIFNLSIRDNLKLVKDDLTDEQMHEACRIACLEDFINTLPNKYDTILGEGGVILSGGQKQRLAIARAFVQKTKIILFDESTSNLDNETQSEIQKAINNLKEKSTILIIAHRLSTIINCDKILLLENGKIVDQGTHEELLNRNISYQTLYKTEILE